MIECGFSLEQFLELEERLARARATLDVLFVLTAAVTAEALHEETLSKLLGEAYEDVVACCSVAEKRQAAIPENHGAG